jgi:hypothetical protein
MDSNSGKNSVLVELEVRVFLSDSTLYSGAAIAQSVSRLATEWMVQGSNPGKGEIFCTRPDRPWGPPASHNMGNGSLSRG